MGRNKKVKASRKHQREIYTRFSNASNEAQRRIANMSPLELGVELSHLGIRTVDQESFKKLVPPHYTRDTQPITAQWLKEMQRNATLDESIFMQVAATKLWLTWFPNQPCDMFLEMSYEEGYESLDASDDESALESWTRFMILLDRRFKGAPSIEAELAKIDEILGEDWDIWFEDYRMLINELLPEERVLKIEMRLLELEKPIDEITMRQIRELEKIHNSSNHSLKH